jgi:pseudouridine-5'-phosphate glycosidase
VNDIIRVAPDVADALRAHRPGVAIESSVLAQGLPIPANRDAARRMLQAVRSRSVMPAITAVVAGTPVLGVTTAELERLLSREGVAKAAARDLPWLMAQRRDGATTVAGALAIASRAGVAVLATGGIGGVHRAMFDAGAVRDESADLLELSRTPMIVVCAGAKSILDLPGTLERLETLGIVVLGYRTAEMPGFLTAQTGIPLSALAESPDEIAAIYRAHRALGRPQAVVVMQPPPGEHALASHVVEHAVALALDHARREHVQGAQVTPFLLAEVERATGGASLAANLALLESNARLAADVARALAEGTERGADAS